MSTLSEFWRRQRDRWYRQGIDRAHALRRHLAHQVARHGFEIGDHSVGAPTIRMYNPSQLKVGKYCSIAAGVTLILGGDHPTDSVTTYLSGKAFGSPRFAKPTRSRGDIVIGSDVWIAANATIASGITIGDGAVVGVGSVVIHDVPPYAVVFGNPARVVSKRFPDGIVEALLALRWWELPNDDIQSLRPLLQGKDVELFISECRKLKGLPCPGAAPLDSAERTRGAVAPGPETAGGPACAQVVAVIRSELPTFSSSDLDRPFEQLGIDSFGMLTLRTELEQSFATTIDDRAWTAVVTPADLVRIVSGSEARDGDAAPAPPAALQRVYNLNMPQMALGGLSESWLFKEVGDLHWSLITEGLRMPSSRLADALGDRLYATFTRFQLDSTAPLASYGENETLTIDARASRYGAGIFFSDSTMQGDGRSARLRLMSSFAKYGEAGANTSLLKGQPAVPPGCAIPPLPDLPQFGREYRARRAEPLAAPTFECEYEIVPSHDINGVGLLYFAAYPIIMDICMMRYGGRAFATGFSTRRRDIFYFANSNADETLIYRIHRWRAGEQHLEIEGSLCRKSDGALMAYAVTSKDRIR
jgi:probable biosynthetic protein (TIGR04098 family)